jgi:hypothetical protein
VQTIDGSGQLDLFDPWQEVFVGHFHLEPSEMRAQTEMLTNPESQMTIRFSIDPKLERILEHLFIPISRGVEESARIAFSNELVSELEIAGRGSREMDDRRRSAGPSGSASPESR